MKTTTFHGTLQLDRTDRTVEGLRIPPSLDNNLAVNFVLTQEPGKLKPKDLKVAIEKNRAEREQRAEEQRKIREESGGGLGGLDVRSILAEEKLNINKSGNAFNRQLREIAFLADVEEVEKQELEKEFRISEDYIGNNLLSEQDLTIIQQQRQLLALYQKKQRWNQILSRNHTISHPGHKNTVITSNNNNNTTSSNQQGEKQATTSSSEPLIPLKAGTNIEVIHELVIHLKPQFDPNRNDIWSKRMNTLRRFVTLTGKWIIRQRVSKRLMKLLFYFHENHVFTREEVLKFIITDNINARNMSTNSNKKDNNKEKEREKLLLTQGSTTDTPSSSSVPLIKTSSTILNDSIKTLNQFSFTEIFFTQIPYNKLKYDDNQEILLKNRLLIKSGESEITPSMIKRNLFPQFNIDILSSKSSSSSTSTVIKPLSSYLKKQTFNDFTFYHLKQKPHYIQYNYQPFELPKIPVYYPPELDNRSRQYAFEESYQRKNANIGMSLAQYEQVAHATTVASGGAVDPIIQISDKCYKLYEADLLAKEKPKRVVIPASLYETLIHDPYKGNLEMHLLEKDKNVIDDIIGDDILPPWLVATIPSSSSSASSSSNKRNKKKMLTLMKIPTNFRIKWNRHELDLLTHYPQFRSFLPLLPFDERCDTWALRPRSTLPQNNPLLYQLDNSLRTKWIHEHGSGFLSCNYYLLGQMESRWRDDFIPPCGPTLNSYYSIDTDRHLSGLSCFKNDHYRDTNEWDGDIEFLQKKLAPTDYLTDSESDNEDEVDESYKPSMKRVKKILKPVKKVEATPVAAAAGGKDKGKGGKAPAPAAAPVPVAKEEAEEEDDINATDSSLTKKEEQVELLRDRKILDLEATYKKSKQFLFSNVSKKLLEISSEMSCLLYTLPIQQSFHEYEHQVYQLMNSMLPELNNSLVEYPVQSSTASFLPTDASLTLTNNFSPVKTFNKYNTFQNIGNDNEKGDLDRNITKK